MTREQDHPSGTGTDGGEASDAGTAPPRPATEAEMAANVRASADQAAAILEHLGRSLEAAGFARSVETYRRMADTLVGQRLWWEGRGDQATEAAFARLSAEAGRIYGVLHPYAQLMAKMAALGPAASADPAAPGDRTAAKAGAGGRDPTRRKRQRDGTAVGHAPVAAAAESGPEGAPPRDAAALIATLEQHGPKLSASRLRALVQLDRKRFDAALDQAGRGGAVRVASVGGRRVVRLGGS